MKSIKAQFSHTLINTPITYCIIFLSFFGLAFVTGSLVLLPSSSDAVDTQVDIIVNPILSITTNPTINMTITPTANGTTTTGDITINAATNNTTGYTLSMNAAAPANIDLVHSNGTNKILNSTNTTAEALATNTWGYNIKTGTTPTTFLSVPALGTPAVLATTNTPSTDTRTVTIGANANTSIPSGYYTSALTFTLIGNYVPPTPLTPPQGSNPSNISATNPQVLDVYPTTGWGGDTIAITSNALFTDVESVTIGGTNCQQYTVVSSSLIACKLPTKAAGTTNDIVVTNNGTNVTPASTYTHMKITYFDPNTTTVTINNTTYDFYPNGFTSANCTAMTPSNAAIGSTPATAIAYVRDPRNNQTYKVKKMVDNKCWMVDNLKYIDTNITNTADNTTGMTYNQGDHLNNGGSGAYNTTDETNTQSTTNSDKAFFNNPMSQTGCYSGTNAPTNTLTHCGYLYNWYAATNGIGTYFQSTEGNQVANSICPAGFRLPSAVSDGITPTSAGTSYDAADIAVLNASTLMTGAMIFTFYPGWQRSGAWGGVFSGYWGSSFALQGSRGAFWSSTVNSATDARNFFFFNSHVSPGNGIGDKLYGLAVRCLLP